nr:type III-B CRISPR module-associated protein Cmr3 [uncultured Methanoregula sp.]
MTEKYLSITPHDPIIARDSRPFGAGLRMKSLDWPYPSVIAGSVRTALGKINGNGFEKIVDALKQVSVYGPLMSLGGTLFFPAPRDLLVDGSNENDRKTYAIRPVALQPGDGCNLPNPALQPAMLPSTVLYEFKPTTPLPFWSLNQMVSWLENPGDKQFNAPVISKNDNDGTPNGLAFPQKESRFHVKMAESSGSAEDGMLFETVGLDFSASGSTNSCSIATRVESANEFAKLIPDLAGCNTIGGERRVSTWEIKDVPPKGWNCPVEIMNALAGKKNLRMVLATPAYFERGWLPGWIDQTTLIGHPPGAPENCTLKLRSACVERWKPISGWSLEKNGKHKPGPKPLRRLVPAGSVYFFECIEGNAQELAMDLWLKPVSDESEDNREKSDGFGLALWGVWDYEMNNKVC